ncbi:type VII secretion system-associated protein [Streptomyces virginiae]|uniref:type VII secretion system-associated protein n=1 Tax=Streptomyces virginiae TaxID=1961 RepID=UPI0036F604BE
MSDSLTPDPARWVTESMRAEAARNPGSWVYAIDPFVDPAGRVPPYAILGAWKVDDQGEITDEFRGNSKYRPSPQVMGMSEPTDPVDAAIQLAASGYGPEAEVCKTLVASSVFLTLEAAIGIGGEAGAVQGRCIVEVFTDVRHAPSVVPELRKMDVRRLAASLPIDSYLKLNPGSSVSVEVPVVDLLNQE